MRDEVVSLPGREAEREHRLGQAGVDAALGNRQLQVQEPDHGLERRFRQPPLGDDDLLPLAHLVADQLRDGVALVAEPAQRGAERVRGGTIGHGRPHDTRLLSRDEDVLVVLTGAPPRSPVHVPAETFLHAARPSPRTGRISVV